RVRRISIVNFTGLRANWGCQATSWELVKFLNSAFTQDVLPSVSYIPLIPRYDIDRAMGQTHSDKVHDSILLVCSETSPARARERALYYLESVCVERYGKLAEQVKNSDVVFF